MGISNTKPQLSRPIVLVPPLIDFPPLAARTRMLESSYNVLFGKLALKCLFEDYFEEANQFTTRIMLKPIDNPPVDLIATVSGSAFKPEQEEKIVGNAQFRWQSDVDDPHTFMDVSVSNSDPTLLMRATAYFPKFGFGAFGFLPLLLKERKSSEDYGLFGLRYGSSNLSVGSMIGPLSAEFPKTAWLVSQMGRLTAGVQYEPKFGSNNIEKYKNLANWSCAIGCGLGSGSLLSPSFNCRLELSNSQLIASLYQRFVVERWVTNPVEENVVGITNYLEFGFEWQTRVAGGKSLNNIHDSTCQVAASWQANENFLLKGKLGPRSSSVALTFKSWWKPSFTFSLSAVKDRTKEDMALGFNINVENMREARYERAEPKYAIPTPKKGHRLYHWYLSGREPYKITTYINSIQLDLDVPKEFHPLDKLL